MNHISEKEFPSLVRPNGKGIAESKRFYLLGSLISPLLRSGPKVPRFEPVNVQTEQAKAIAGNQASLPALEKLAGETNTFNQDQLLAMLRRAIPNYDNLVKKAGGNIEDMLSGNLPSDVVDFVRRNAAGKALYGGFSGTGMARNLTARDLGFTSLDLTQKALDSATRWFQSSKALSVPQQFDLSSMFISPVFQAQFTAAERNAKFQRNWVKNQIDSQYELGNQYADALITIEAQFAQMASSVAGSAAGAAMCWVARECFGESNPKWLMFREWLLNDSPKWFLNLYRKHGEKFAAWIKDKPRIKEWIRKWMESRIASAYV